jgi:hypothetical protein
MTLDSIGEPGKGKMEKTTFDGIYRSEGKEGSSVAFRSAHSVNPIHRKISWLIPPVAA